MYYVLCVCIIYAYLGVCVCIFYYVCVISMSVGIGIFWGIVKYKTRIKVLKLAEPVVTQRTF